jgi:3-oxoacyl-[acyl-carrier-protein] synthase II
VTPLPSAEVRKVIVTGLGVVGPAADNVESLWNLLLNERAPRPVEFDAPAYVGNHRVYKADDTRTALPSRAERLAMQSCSEALRDSGLDRCEIAGAGVFVGTAQGSIDLFEQQSLLVETNCEHQLYSISQMLATEHGCSGPNQVLSTACSASLNAVGLAAEYIMNNQVDVMIVSGMEICGTIALGCFDRLGAMDPLHCRPFDIDRAGTVFGEGSATLVLESEEHFLARGGGRAYCSVDGFGWSCDAYHPTAPEPSGEAILAAVIDALKRAKCNADDISCVIPHGTGTKLNDAIEASMLERLLGNRLALVPVLPVKAFIGHGAGAAGAFSCVVAALICRNRIVPSAANCERPEFKLRLPVEAEKHADRGKILINGWAFGGNNAAVLMGAL